MQYNVSGIQFPDKINSSDVVNIVGDVMLPMALNLPSGIKILGNNHMVKSNAGGIFNIGRGVKDVSISDIIGVGTVDKYKSAALVTITQGIGTKITNLTNAGPTMLLKAQGAANTELKRFKEVSGVNVCGYTIFTGELDGVPCTGLLVEDGEIYAKASGYWHCIRNQKTKNAKFHRIRAVNDAPGGHSVFNYKEFGPVEYIDCEAGGSNGACGLGPLDEAYEEGWEKLFLSNVVIRNFKGSSPSWNWDIHAGTSDVRFEVTVDPKTRPWTAPQCGVNIRGGFSGVEPKTLKHLSDPNGIPIRPIPKGIYLDPKILINSSARVKGHTEALIK
jgi:hypothetical protein